MKRALFVTIVLLLLVSLAGYTGGQGETDGSTAEDTSGKTVVTFRSWSPVTKTTEKMIEAFEKHHPDINVQASIYNYAEYTMDLTTRAASDTMPDLIGLEPGAFTQQYRKYLVAHQDKAAEKWGADWRDKFYPVGIIQARLGNPSGDENFYGLPVLVQTINAWYTLPIFQDAGFEPPKNYQELKKQADYFNKEGIAPLMVGAADGWLNRDIYMMLIHNLAPGLIYEAEEGHAKFTDEPFVEAMTWWKKLFDENIIQVGALGLSAYPGSQELIEAGRAAMFPLGAWWMQMAGNPNPPPLSKGLQGFAPMIFPDVSGAGEPAEDLLGGIDVMIGVTKSSKNKDAAFEVLFDFIDGYGAQELINTFNDVPAVKGLEPEVFENNHQRDVWNTFTVDWMPKVRYARQLRDPDVKQALEDALAAVAGDELSPAEGMQKVQDAWEPLK